MMKATLKPDYSKMRESELKLLLNKHQQMLNNTRLIDALPDKGQRLRNAAAEIQNYLDLPPSPMECDTITNQFSQMNVSSNDIDMPEQQVHLEKPTTNFHRRQNDNNFSDQRLNVVKQRLMARQAEHNSKAIITKAKLISLDEAIRLCNEERKQREEHLIQQTTARLLGNMSLSKATFGPPPTKCKTDLAYRKTTTENVDDDDIDELGRAVAETTSDHESDEIDYPDEEENDDD